MGRRWLILKHENENLPTGDERRVGIIKKREVVVYTRDLLGCKRAGN
jgi:hypothetical protein